MLSDPYDYWKVTASKKGKQDRTMYNIVSEKKKKA
jgi:hypothetical protein